MDLKSQHKIKEILNKARKERKSTKRLIKSFSAVKPMLLDNAFEDAHDFVFERTDCLVCANCCKTSSPIIINKDVERISAHLRMKAGDFVVKYLRIDEDEDYVFQQTPCIFLNEDNTCQIYDIRPKACREYPHTNRKNMYEILELTYKNSMVCPAVYEILLRLEDVGR